MALKERTVIHNCRAMSDGTISLSRVTEIYDDNITPTPAVPEKHDANGKITQVAKKSVTDIKSQGLPHYKVIENTESLLPEEADLRAEVRAMLEKALLLVS